MYSYIRSPYLQKAIFFLFICLFIGMQFPCNGQEQLNIFRPLHLQWLYEINLETNNTPVADGNALYTFLKNGNLLALQIKNGDFLWERDNGGRVSSTPAIDKTSVYIASTIVISQSHHPQRKASAYIRAISLSNGVTRWTRSVPSPIIGILSSNEMALFGYSSDGGLYSVEKETGNLLWVKYNTNSFNNSPFLTSDSIFISDRLGNLFKLDQKTGKTIKRYQTRIPLLNNFVTFDKTIFISTIDGFVYAFEEITGRIKWRVQLNGSVQFMLNAGRCLLATSLDNFIYCLSPQRGTKLWKRRLNGRVAAQPLILEDTVLLTTIVGEECLVLSLNDGRLINSIYIGEDNATQASPILSGNLILLATRKGLFAFSSQPSVEAPK